MPLRGPRSWSRETRLLWLTIAVSVSVLLVLARFRFPDERRVAPVPQPLERLSARATYDELAADVARLERRLAASLVVLRGQSARSTEPRTLQGLFDRRAPDATTEVFLPALRVRDDIAVTVLNHDTTIQGVVGQDDAVPLVLAADPLRRLAVVRVPRPASNAAWQLPSTGTLSVPRYVAAADGSRGGFALRPVFIGRADRFEEPRWASPMIVLGGTPVAADGAFVFSLDGEVVGLVVHEAGVCAIVPAATLDAAVNVILMDGTPHVTDFGVALRSLSGADIRTLGVTAGLIVNSVEPKSLADGRLRAGDLLLAIDARPAVSVDAVLVSLSRARPGTTVRFQVRRKDATLDVDITVPDDGPVIGATR